MGTGGGSTVNTDPIGCCPCRTDRFAQAGRCRRGSVASLRSERGAAVDRLAIFARVREFAPRYEDAARPFRRAIEAAGAAPDEVTTDGAAAARPSCTGRGSGSGSASSGTTAPQGAPAAATRLRGPGRGAGAPPPPQPARWLLRPRPPGRRRVLPPPVAQARAAPTTTPLARRYPRRRTALAGPDLGAGCPSPRATRRHRRPNRRPSPVPWHTPAHRSSGAGAARPGALDRAGAHATNGPGATS
jgi:hypothetical protein